VQHIVFVTYQCLSRWPLYPSSIRHVYFQIRISNSTYILYVYCLCLWWLGIGVICLCCVFIKAGFMCICQCLCLYHVQSFNYRFQQPFDAFELRYKLVSQQCIYISTKATRPIPQQLQTQDKYGSVSRENSRPGSTWKLSYLCAHGSPEMDGPSTTLIQQ
jgi:hypothetical protein